VKRLRVLVLTDESLVPPADYAGADYTDEPWRMERDIEVALRSLGHEVRMLGVVRNVEAIEAVHREWRPHVAFNLLEDVYGVIAYDHNMVSFLELIDLAYTGCNPLGLVVSRDKALTKKLLAYHRIAVPRFLVCRPGRVATATRRWRAVHRPKGLEFPLIVKPLLEDSSAGISRQSVVEDDASLVERVKFVHERFESDAIVEEFIAGRELYVGVIGNYRLDVLPAWELTIANQPEGVPLVATARVKWHRGYQKRLGVKTRPAKDLPEGFASRLERLSRRIYRILGLSGYARLDYRLGSDGRAYLVEANANPQLARGEDFAASAEHGGVSYAELIQRIVSLGLRWKEAHAIA
jgi:D-alanine-D-alanine ligase